MIHALEMLGIAQPLGPKAIAAVQADIGKGAHRSVGLPHDEDGFLADLGADVIAGFGNVAGPAAQQPDLGPDMLPLQLHEVLAGVASGWNDVIAEIGILGLFRRGAVRPFSRIDPFYLLFSLDVHFPRLSLELRAVGIGAVDDKVRPVAPFGSRAGEEHDAARNFLGLAQAARRMLAQL